MLVAVILSTHNGERYLRGQLESLLAQDYPSLEFRIRDDGSTDGTVGILKEYASRDPRIHVMEGRNAGVVHSFFTLLESVDPASAYVAFCDQDDIWAPSKIRRGVERLEQIPIPTIAMYCSRLRIVDQDLQPLGLSPPLRRPPTFANALVQNIATGCSMIINRMAREMLLAHRPTSARVIMHDWWVYQVTAALGVVVYDNEAMISYRQHGGNVVGAAQGWAAWRGRLVRFWTSGQRFRIREQVEELARCFGDVLPASPRTLLDEFRTNVQAASLWRRIRYALRTPVYRQQAIDNLILRLLIIGGRLG